MNRCLTTIAVGVVAATSLCIPAAAEGVLVLGRNVHGGFGAWLFGNYETAAEARAAGLERCRSEGMAGCYIAETYRKMCFSFAVSHQGSGLGWSGGATIQDAEHRAIAQCRHHNFGAACFAHTSACDVMDEQERLQARQEQQEQQRRAREEQAEREREDWRIAQEQRRAERQAALEREREEREKRAKQDSRPEPRQQAVTSQKQQSEPRVAQSLTATQADPGAILWYLVLSVPYFYLAYVIAKKY